MPDDHSAKALPEQPARRRSPEWDTLEDIGGILHRIAALLRASVNTGPDGGEDAENLVTMAQEEVERAEQRYLEWALPSREVA